MSSSQAPFTRYNRFDNRLYRVNGVSVFHFSTDIHKCITGGRYRPERPLRRYGVVDRGETPRVKMMMVEATRSELLMSMQLSDVGAACRRLVELLLVRAWFARRRLSSQLRRSFNARSSIRCCCFCRYISNDIL